MPLVPIPAVDIRGGRCVRLVQGDFGREKVYADDPVDAARRWQEEGAERLHVVDLDGAREGRRQNADVVRRLLAEVTMPVQVGGGVRSLEIARELLAQGADRVVMGTAALEDLDRLRDWVAELSAARVVIGLDCRGGRVATHGWTETSELRLLDVCERLEQAGVERILYTDIGRDGTLDGPDVEGVRTLVERTSLRILASGGVARVDDLRALAEAGAEGVIIGTALYDGRLSFADALAAVREPSPGFLAAEPLSRLQAGGSGGSRPAEEKLSPLPGEEAGGGESLA